MLYPDTLQEIQNLIAGNEKVLLFIGDFACSTSRSLDDKIEALLQRHPEVLGVHTILAALPSLAGAYMAFTAPLILLFINGKEVFREGRFLQIEALEAFL